MGFGGQKVLGRQEIFLVSGAVSRANNSRCVEICLKYFLPVGWLWTAGLLLLTSFTVMRLATTGYADEIFSQNILQDSNA